MPPVSRNHPHNDFVVGGEELLSAPYRNMKLALGLPRLEGLLRVEHIVGRNGCSPVGDNLCRETEVVFRKETPEPDINRDTILSLSGGLPRREIILSRNHIIRVRLKMHIILAAIGLERVLLAADKRSGTECEQN